MSPADEVQLVLSEEVEDDISSEDEADSSFGLPPHLDGGFRVCPEEVAEEASIGNVGGSDDGVDLVDSDEVRGESAVHAQDFVLDEGCYGYTVETVDKSFPQFDVVAGLA